jgi:photosystem II stability/assembly factor-like uncharacterized protein
MNKPLINSHLKSVLASCVAIFAACVPLEPNVDSGVSDAGIPERRDAGQTADAGIDAGPVDSGLLDAGMADAGERKDAGVDAGIPTIDAGVDAGELLLPAGAVWTQLTTDLGPSKQDDIHFVDAAHGWYANGDGKLYRTIDTGQTWTKVLEKAGTYWRALGFVDENLGFLGNIGTDYFPGVTDTTPLYVTTNGGQTIAPVTYTGPTVKGICAIDVLHTQFINAGVLTDRVVIHAAGRVGGPPHFLRSIDKGATWVSKDLSAVIAMITDIKFFSESVGFIVGGDNSSVAASHAVILKTIDGGNTWKNVYTSSRGYELIWKMSFPNAQTGFATVQNYQPGRAQQLIVKTTDSGESWQEKPLVTNAGSRQFGVGFISPLVGWVGAANTGFQTINGGDTWAPVSMGQAVNKIRVVPAPGGFVAYAIGFDVYQLDARR